MSWSVWRSAGSVAYWTDTGIEFTDGDAVLDRTTDLISKQYLTGVSTSFNSTVLQQGSRGLIFGGFGLSAGTVDQIELRIRADRLARIIDERVQLYVQKPLGNNVADTSTENFKTYGGPLKDYWGVTGLDVSAGEFAVLIDFAPRPDLPSSNPLIVRSVDIRAHYIN